jgi:pimeloyl-ACP methyl ester carboxylesterase
MWRGLLLIILWSLACGWVAASDLLREQRYALEIRDGLVVGKAISLKAGEQEFLAIHGESDTSKIKGGVILLHGMGANPAWSVVVQPLRMGLTEHGWETLSLQMPVAPRGAEPWAYTPLIPEAAPRIAAAIKYLQQRKLQKIVLVGHSMGARMGLETLAAGVPNGVIAFVAVGIPTSQDDPDAGTLGALKKLKLPMLDIYGSRDLPSVLTTVKARKIAARQAGNAGYRQVEILGADHYFRGMDEALMARVNAWMGREAAQSKLEFQGTDPAGPGSQSQ